jgi:hypothetical protein
MLLQTLGHGDHIVIGRSVALVLGLPWGRTATWANIGICGICGRSGMPGCLSVFSPNSLMTPAKVVFCCDTNRLIRHTLLMNKEQLARHQVPCKF